MIIRKSIYRKNTRGSCASYDENLSVIKTVLFPFPNIISDVFTYFVKIVDSSYYMVMIAWLPTERNIISSTK